MRRRWSSYSPSRYVGVERIEPDPNDDDLVRIVFDGGRPPVHASRLSIESRAAFADLMASLFPPGSRYEMPAPRRFRRWIADKLVAPELNRAISAGPSGRGGAKACGWALGYFCTNDPQTR